MQYERFTYPSSDGKNTVSAYFFLPDADVKLCGIVQISHGMCDYIARYTHLANALTCAGYVVCGNDHLGHGQTAACPEDFGFFADSEGIGYLLDDLHAMTGIAKARFAELPMVLLGHSMGSFLCRLYATRFGYELDGLIIKGTGGPNPLIPVGKLLARIMSRFKGNRYRSSFIKNMSFSGYNSEYSKEEQQDPNAWLTRDREVRDMYASDSYCSFTFTLSAYLDLFTMLEQSNDKSWFKEYPKDLRTLIVSGAMDPVGKWGEGTTYVAETLAECGVKDVTLKLYADARHELHNELCHDMFFADVVQWLDSITSGN